MQISTTLREYILLFLDVFSFSSPGALGRQSLCKPNYHPIRGGGLFPFPPPFYFLNCFSVVCKESVPGWVFLVMEESQRLWAKVQG